MEIRKDAEEKLEHLRDKEPELEIRKTLKKTGISRQARKIPIRLESKLLTGLRCNRTDINDERTETRDDETGTEPRRRKDWMVP